MIRSISADYFSIRSFYSLSKKHHPDLHPNDPSASKRFVQISEAYHTLGSKEKRQRYDRDYTRVFSGSSSSPIPRGSYSSAAGPAGSRPASGLSRRRTQFRGPPPSFYRGGEYGAQGAKRAQYAYTGQSEPGEETFSASGPGGGFGPGQGEERFDPDIPHWDRAGHRKTHDSLWERRSSASTEQRFRDWDEIAAAQGSMIFNFIWVTGIVVGVTAVTTWLWESRQSPKKKDTEGA